jgi:ketosteroid isomerase-like protein
VPDLRHLRRAWTEIDHLLTRLGLLLRANTSTAVITRGALAHHALIAAPQHRKRERPPGEILRGMSEENVETVLELLATFGRGDYDAALEVLDPAVEWHTPPGVMIGEHVYRGREEVQKGFSDWLGAWDTFRFEIRETLDKGEHVVVCGLQIGRGRGSGVDVSLPTFHVFTLSAGKITHHRAFSDREAALEAAGVPG